MPPERKWSKAMWAAVVLWTAVVGGTCLRSFMQPEKRTLFTLWAAGGVDWLAGVDLYRERDGLDTFRYSPTAAMMMVPCALVPPGLGGAIWRLASAAALLGCFSWWLRKIAPPPSESLRPVCFLLLLPLSLESLNNAQMNLFIAALLMVTVAAAEQGRWTWAAFAVSLAAALKVYPLALGLVLAAAYPRRFAPRLLLALGVTALLPFAAQSTDYVLGQYASWFTHLRTSDAERRLLYADGVPYRDLYMLLHVWAVKPPLPLYRCLQFVAGAACAAWCLAARLRGRPERLVLRDAYVLSSCWMLLCGPATEACTFVLLAPMLAWRLVQPDADGPAWTRDLTILGAGFLVLNLLSGTVPGGTARFHPLGLHPLGCLLVTLSYLGSQVGPLRRATAESWEVQHGV